MRPPINSLKHYVQMTLQTAGAGTVIVPALARAVETVGGGADECRVGSIVKAIYIELWVRAGDTAGGAFQCAIGKATAGSGGPTFANMGNLHDFNQKNNVLFFSQAQTNDQDADAIPVYRGWIKIPKGKQRLALGERFYVAVSGFILDVIFCGMATYKEYY